MEKAASTYSIQGRHRGREPGQELLNVGLVAERGGKKQQGLETNVSS